MSVGISTNCKYGLRAHTSADSLFGKPLPSVHDVDLNYRRRTQLAGNTSDSPIDDHVRLMITFAARLLDDFSTSDLSAHVTSRINVHELAPMISDNIRRSIHDCQARTHTRWPTNGSRRACHRDLLSCSSVRRRQNRRQRPTAHSPTSDP